MDESSPPSWLGRSGYFRTVLGAQPATDLLVDPRMHADLRVIFAGFGVTEGPAWDVASASLLSMNGDEHKRVRALVAPWFTPRAVEWVRPIAHADLERRVAQLVDAGRCELVTELASPYVIVGTCTFVGIPVDEIALFMPYVQLAESVAQDVGSRLPDLAEALVGLDEYARSLLERRAREPRDDLLSRIAASVTEGALAEPIASALVAALLSAGHAPTTYQIGLLVEVLSEHPDVWDAVGAGSVPPAPVVEEVLRFRSTNQGISRRVAEEFDYDGVRFDEGEHVIVRLADANHDPDRYAAPSEFDVDAHRTTSHLAFGFGAHYCLGAALARVQLQEALRVLSRTFTCPTVLRADRREGGGLRGHRVLDVAFEGRDRAPSADLAGGPSR